MTTKHEILGSMCAFALMCAGAEAALAEGVGRVWCDITENGESASGVVSLQQKGHEVASGACGKEFTAPVGSFVAALRLDGALDGPEQRRNIVVDASGLVKLQANFNTGTLEVRIASLGKRAAGLAIIKRNGQQLGTLGSGVAAHLSAGTYRVIARYRGQEKDLGDVNIGGGKQVTLDTAFE
jgi:hypothetical protein